MLKGHTAHILALAATADGKRLFSSGADRKIRGWDTDTGKETLTLPREGEEIATSLAVSADGKRLVSMCGNTVSSPLSHY